VIGPVSGAVGPGAAPAVAAVVTAFDPGPSLTTVVASVLGQVAAVVVVDDGSTSAAAERALDACAALGCTLIRHGANRGVAAALNSGVAQVISAHTELTDVLTLDQDSVVPAGYVRAALAARESAQRAGLHVAMVAPEHVAGLPSRVRSARGDTLVGNEPIQSGLLVGVDVLRAVGPFDESLFIDGVDSDFYLRCLDTGRLVVLARGTALGHRLGGGHPVRLLGRPLLRRGVPVELTHARPFRYYFLSRNRIALAREHGRRHPRWAAGQLLGLARHLVLVLALVPGRGERARWVLCGIRDGCRGVGGPAPRT